jgi:hypothetical protein
MMSSAKLRAQRTRALHPQSDAQVSCEEREGACVS